MSCVSADIRITGTSGQAFAGGLIGYIDGTAEINNSYAVVDMDVDYINYAGGLVGAGNNAEISNSYAAGKSLTGKWAGGTVSGIANKGTITNSVSIFPEMTSVNRISQGGTLSGNYGFVGTTARNSNWKSFDTGRKLKSVQISRMVRMRQRTAEIAGVLSGNT